MKKNKGIECELINDESNQPFFTRFLSKQQDLNEDELKDISGGNWVQPGDLMVTMKYPSDGEDSSGNFPDLGGGYVTMKYPSDSDEGGIVF